MVRRAAEHEEARARWRRSRGVIAQRDARDKDGDRRVPAGRPIDSAWFAVAAARRREPARCGDPALLAGLVAVPGRARVGRCAPGPRAGRARRGAASRPGGAGRVRHLRRARRAERGVRSLSSRSSRAPPSSCAASCAHKGRRSRKRAGFARSTPSSHRSSSRAPPSRGSGSCGRGRIGLLTRSLLRRPHFDTRWVAVRGLRPHCSRLRRGVAPAAPGELQFSSGAPTAVPRSPPGAGQARDERRLWS